MATQDETIEVVDDTERGRFVVLVDGEKAGHADYRLVEGSLVFPHTEVSKEFGGRGLGSRLVETALASAHDAGRKVVPLCPFFASYLEKNPEAAEIDVELYDRLRR